MILQLPVQHGKTRLASVGMSAWFLGRNPDKFVTVISHTQPFARDQIGAPARSLFERHGDRIFDLKIDRRSDASDRWNIAGHAGGFYCDGVGGQIEGRSIHLAVIDDPIGSIPDAQSKVVQDRLWDWYQGQLRTRFHPQTGMVVIMSRWTTDDFVARLIDAGASGAGPKPVVLDLPAIALPPLEYAGGADPLGRAEGEALWPEVRPRKFLDETRAAISDRWFLARFQGRPGKEQGAFYKREWFKYYRTEVRAGAPGFTTIDPRNGLERFVRAADLRVRQYVDPAASQKKEADYFVVTTVGIDRGNKDLYVMSVLRKRIPGPEQVTAMRLERAKWNASVMKIEAVGYQVAFFDSCVAEGLPVVRIERGKGDKSERATYSAIRYQQGTIFHPRAAPWLRDFEDELLAFPHGGHDDQVDTIADAAADLLSNDGNELAGGRVDPW